MNRLGIFLPRRLFCACVVRMFLRVLVWCFGRTCLSLYSVFQPVRFRRILIPTEKFIRMKKIIVLFLVTWTLCRCCVTFARPVEIETAFRILPQRVSHIRITKFDHFTYVMRFAYDAQGRIVSVVESDFRYLDDGTSKPDRISTVEYDGPAIVPRHTLMMRPDIFSVGHIGMITPSNMKIRSPLQTTFLRDGTDLSRAKNSS